MSTAVLCFEKITDYQMNREFLNFCLTLLKADGNSTNKKMTDVVAMIIKCLFFGLAGIASTLIHNMSNCLLTICGRYTGALIQQKEIIIILK